MSPHQRVVQRCSKPARSLRIFLSLGVKHILTGYDHLLFLFGLLLVARGFFSSLGYHHFIYDRALDHTGSGNTAARANSKSNC
jgi:hypothetical protein